jgi:hypothetical protein
VWGKREAPATLRTFRTFRTLRPRTGRFGPCMADRLRIVGFRAEIESDIGPWVRAKLLVNLGGIVAALCDDPPAEVIAAAQDEAIVALL